MHATRNASPLMERLRAEAADCDVRRVQFAPGGADVRAL